MYSNKELFNIVAIFLLVTTTFIIISDADLDITGIVVRLERVVCACGQYCTVTTCKVKFISRTEATVNVIGLMIKDITALKYAVNSYYKFSNNEYRPMGVVSGFSDYCALQASVFTTPIHNALMNIIGNYTNINHKCPFESGEYYLKDMKLGAYHLPSIFPVGRYRFNTSWYMQSDIWLGNVTVYFSLSNYGVKDWNLK